MNKTLSFNWQFKILTPFLFQQYENNNMYCPNHFRVFFMRHL